MTSRRDDPRCQCGRSGSTATIRSLRAACTDGDAGGLHKCTPDIALIRRAVFRVFPTDGSSPGMEWNPKAKRRAAPLCGFWATPVA